MQTSIVFLALIGLALAGTVPKVSEFDFEHFKVKYEKSYENKNEEMYRKAIFDKSVERIKKHNRMYISGLESYWMGINQFSDKLYSEVITNDLVLGDFKIEDDVNYEARLTEYIPDFVDWRGSDGVVQDIKGQMFCLRTWAFSTTGSLEGQMMLKQNKSISLSEGQMVDCSKVNSEGAVMKEAFDYIEKYGLESEADYPYWGNKKQCRYDKSKVVARISGSKMLKPTEDSLMHAIANIGPISIAPRVNFKFIDYSGGIFDDPSCSSQDFKIALLAVGYGSEMKNDYYIVKNSWGNYWGEYGYIRMSRNKNNQCGVASYLVYPIVDKA